MSTKINPIYLKGFNHGYLLAEHLSTLAQNMLTGQNQGQYFEGFGDGVDTFLQHQKVQSRSEELDSVRDQKKDDRERER